jgi:ubiquinone/menaquinone biosynthesis C-methylase UbiE
MSYKNQYFSYLKKRSLRSFIYRKYYVYPKYKFYTKGQLLDVGCGIGEILGYYQNSIGVDINSACVNYCKSIGLKAKVMKSDKLPFKNEKFDTVMFDNVLEHIDNPTKIIKEIYRVMKKNSYLLVGVPGKKGFSYDPDHKIFYDKKKLKQTFKDNNFKFVKNFYTPFKSSFLNNNARQYCLHGIFLKK